MCCCICSFIYVLGFVFFISCLVSLLLLELQLPLLETFTISKNVVFRTLCGEMRNKKYSRGL